MNFLLMADLRPEPLGWLIWGNLNSEWTTSFKFFLKLFLALIFVFCSSATSLHNYECVHSSWHVGLWSHWVCPDLPESWAWLCVCLCACVSALSLFTSKCLLLRSTRVNRLKVVTSLCVCVCHCVYMSLSGFPLVVESLHMCMSVCLLDSCVCVCAHKGHVSALSGSRNAVWLPESTAVTSLGPAEIPGTGTHPLPWQPRTGHSMTEFFIFFSNPKPNPTQILHPPTSIQYGWLQRSGGRSSQILHWS